MQSELNPVSAGERIMLLDILRGIAIFGILIVNMQAYYNPVSLWLTNNSGSHTFQDMLPEAFIRLLFEGKFYVLFSLLFGYGFWLFINRSNEDQRKILILFIRRLIFLLVIGIFHVVFLWAGDILVFYALLGIILVLFRNTKDTTLVYWSIFLTLIPTFLAITNFAANLPEILNEETIVFYRAGADERAGTMQEFIDKASAIYAGGSFIEITKVRLTEYRRLLHGNLYFYPMVLAMFILGLRAARSRLFSDYRLYLPLFHKTLWWGLIAGIFFSGLYTCSYLMKDLRIPGFWNIAATLSSAGGGFFLCTFYVSAITLLYAAGRFDLPAKYLAPVGRMALTNYLLQSIICTTLFLSYGFGLFGKITGLHGIMITFAVFAFQSVFSYYWLKQFYYGPMEWLWRSLTYLKCQPFRRRVTAETF